MSPSHSGRAWGEPPARSASTGSEVHWPRAPLWGQHTRLGKLSPKGAPPPVVPRPVLGIPELRVSPAACRQAVTRSRSSSAARRSPGTQGTAAVAVRAMGLSSEGLGGGAWSARAGGRAGGARSVAPGDGRTPFIHGWGGKFAAQEAGKFPELLLVLRSGRRRGPAPWGSWK